MEVLTFNFQKYSVTTLVDKAKLVPCFNYTCEEV